MTESIIQECLNYLNIVGVNPFVGGFFANVRYIYHFFHQFISGILLIMEIIIHWKGVETLENDSEIIIGTCQTIAKTLTMYKMRQEMKDLLEQLNLFWPMDKFDITMQEELENICNSIRFAYIIFRNSILASAIGIIIKPFFSSVKELPLKTFDVCNMGNNACYLFCLAWQVLFISHMVISATGFDGLFFIFLTRVYCQFKTIKHGITMLYLDCPSEDVLVERTVELVSHHDFLLRYLKSMKSIYSNYLFIQFFASVVEVCLVTVLFSLDGLKPSTDRIVRYVPLLVMLLAQIYLYCIAGQKIADECDSVADTAYECGWCNEYHPRIRKSICLIIQRGHMHVKLSAAGLFYLDMETFGNILRKSGSLYMAIQQFYVDTTAES